VEAELTVAVGAPWVSGAVLLPQQLQGDALALEFLMDVRKLDRGVACRGSAHHPEQLRLQRRLVNLRGQRPADARIKGALQIAGDRSLGQTGGSGNTLMAELGLEFERQDFFDLAHGFSLVRHPRLRKKIGEDNPSQLKTSTNQAFIPFETDRRFRNVTANSGLRPKSVTFARNPRSVSSGIVGQFQPEIAVTFVRNTHNARIVSSSAANYSRLSSCITHLRIDAARRPRRRALNHLPNPSPANSHQCWACLPS
jgi:hypothetical protein